MRIYPVHLQNWLDIAQNLLIFLILASTWLCETGQIWYNWRFRTHWRNSLKFDMLMYPELLWSWWHLVQALLVFLILTVCWLSDTNQICSFHIFLWEKWAEICHEDVSYPPLELIRIWSRPVKFTHFFHVCSLVLYQFDQPLAAKGCHSYQMPGSISSFLMWYRMKMKKASLSIWKLFSYRAEVSLTAA